MIASHTALRRARLFLAALAVALPATVAEATEAPEATPATPPNVILFTVDTMRHDRIGAYGHALPTTPALDALAAEGIVFGDTVASSAWTSPGLVSVLTGLFGPRHGVIGPGRSVAPGTPSFATVLEEAGYAVPNLVYLTTIPNYANLGFGPLDRELTTEGEGDTLERWLDSKPAEPFFLWYHYRFVHLPFSPSPAELAPFLPEGASLPDDPSPGLAAVMRDVIVPKGSTTFAVGDAEWVSALYDAEVRRMDRFLGGFVSRLREHGHLDRSVMVVTADHGEELFDHGWVGHASTTLEAHLHEELIRIPWIMRLPRAEHAGRWVTTQARQVDVLPTVLELLGLDAPADIDGRSLLPAIRGEAMEEAPAILQTVVSGYQTPPARMREEMTGIRSGGYKLILRRGIERAHLYHTATDPLEHKDLAGLGLPEETRLRNELARWLAEHHPGFFVDQADAPVLDQEVPADTPCPVVREPAPGSTLAFDDTSGSVHARWDGSPDLLYVLEYDVGEGSFHTSGRITVRGNEREFGPYPREVWHSLDDFNPWTVTVRLPGRPDCPAAPATFRFE